MSEKKTDGASATDSFIRDVARAEPVAPPASLVGKALGQFRIDAKLGAGGMGVVYRATDTKLRREVAIKVLPESLAGDDERRSRLLREARSAAAITHPNLAAIHDVGEADGRVFIVMELVEGESLRARLAAAGRLGVSEAIRVAREMLRGLAGAHEKGVIHRDLKPENVMLAKDGTVKILDFGLAKVREVESALALQDTATDEGRVMGTPAYMSPEQAAGKSIDARSDLFSLGVVLYEMASGERPFGGATTAEILAAVLRDEPRRLDGLDEALERVILRCLRKAPDERFASADEMLAALDTIGTARPAGRRWLGIVATSGVAAALAIALGLRATVPTHATTPVPSVTVNVTTLVNLPPPPTSVPEAASEYAAGLEMMHDDNFGMANQHFIRASELDPGLAAAYMRTAMTGLALLSPEAKRAAYAKAAGLRKQLTERDRDLLEAMEPVLQFTQPDGGEALRRLDALTRRYPSDAEIFMWIGIMNYATPASLAPSTRATELDPRDAQSWETRGMALLSMGRTEEARAAFERGVATSVGASDPYLWLGFADWVDGRCADFERNIRRAADRAPWYAGYWLLWAKVGNSRSPQVIREAATQAIGTTPEPRRAIAAAELESQLAMLDGDFERAADLMEKEAATLAADPLARTEQQPHYALAMRQVGARLETGDLAGARAAASAYVEQADSWTAESSLTHGVDLWPYLYRLGRGGSGGLEAERAKWIATRGEMGAVRGVLWIYAYAAPALTRDEADAALRALPEYVPLSPVVVGMGFPSNDVGIPDGEVGRVYLLANRVDEALPFLRHAVAECGVFHSPFAHVHAALDLGRALEAKSDTPGACDAYARVLARFGNAKPRSVSADTARARRKALGCGAGLPKP